MSNCALHMPRTVEEAVALHGGSATAHYVAGGATLVALLNARLVEPALLIGLADIAGLAGITVAAAGEVEIGAMTRHAVTEADCRLIGGLEAVREAAGHIASPAIRNMGTMGGSIAFADPGADYPAALVAAGARVVIAGLDGEREVLIEDFFVDWYATALEPGDMVRMVRLPRAAPGSGGAYEKLSRVEGDYATASVAAVVEMQAGRCVSARLAVGGCGPVPIRLPDADAALAGTALDGPELERAGRVLADAADPVDDMRGSAAYRRRVIPALIVRAARRAKARAEKAR